MKPIKKPEFRSLKKSVASQPAAEDFPLFEPVIAAEPIVEQPAQEVAHPATEYFPIYAPVQEYPILHSVANSGWQASDIWRELRVDNFCD